MSKTPRRRILVDAPLQCALLCRVVVYWLLCLTVMFALVALQSVWAGQEVGWPVLVSRTLIAFGPALIASMVLLPLVLFDALRFSHRFAGPLHRLINEARRLADGQTLQPVKFRRNDYWTELATEFNRVSDEVHRLRQAGEHESGESEETLQAADAD
ncbi:MAG: hypothetical protein AAGG46_06940 [Planctomycetota bacterium]